MATIEANENTFNRVMPSNGPALVVFKSMTCGPCRALAPTVNAIGVGNPSLPVVVVDVLESPMIARKFNVRTVPAPFWVEVSNGVITSADRISHSPAGLSTEVRQRLAR